MILSDVRTRYKYGSFLDERLKYHSGCTRGSYYVFKRMFWIYPHEQKCED